MDGGDLEDEEWVLDPTSVPPTPLNATPPSKAHVTKGCRYCQRLFSTSSADDDGQDKIVLRQYGKEPQTPERSARTSIITIGFGTVPVVVVEPGTGRGDRYGGWR
jgi:hypothetical protein